LRKTSRQREAIQRRRRKRKNRSDDLKWLEQKHVVSATI